MNKADGEIDKITGQFTSTPESAARFDSLRERYVNESVSSVVKNTSSLSRIIEIDGSLVQNVYPIYNDDHKPLHKLDFISNLFQPTKYFLDRNIDTLYFNIAVIWSMSFFLYVALYFDLLKRLIKLLEGNRKYLKKDRNH